MKNLLVDALREANSSDQNKALSDSGSYDTSSEDYSATANDAEVEQSALTDADLALYETGVSIEVGAVANDVPTPDPQESTADRNSVSQTVEQGHPGAAAAAPALARYAPLICLLFAGITASAWFAIHFLQWGFTESGIAVSQSPSTIAQIGSSSGVDSSGPTEKFPYIDQVVVMQEPKAGR